MRARRRISLALLCALVLTVTGCGGGMFYTHTVRPLTTNFTETPVALESMRGDVKHVQYQVSVLWDENGIGEIGKKAGFQEIYYADLELLSFFGIWTQYYVHVYGRK